MASGATGETQGSAELNLQTKTVVAYGTHIMHVLHILLTGKWDPIALLDDNDLWISSQSFVTATGHAVNAAEAVGDVIDYDPDLSFMPFFFGVYLLQGSFLLLLFADKLQGDVSSDVVKACETIVRAHEACVATLDTQYQVCIVILQHVTANMISEISEKSCVPLCNKFEVDYEMMPTNNRIGEEKFSNFTDGLVMGRVWLYDSDFDHT